MQKKTLVKAMAGNQFSVFDALLREMKLEFVRYIIQRFFCDFQLNENPSVYDSIVYRKITWSGNFPFLRVFSLMS